MAGDLCQLCRCGGPIHNAEKGRIIGKDDLMDFYETRMGQEFYTNTVPRITKALEDIAKSLNAPAPVVQLPQNIPEDFLTDLYLGNYDPSDEPEPEEITDCTAEIIANEAALHKAVSPDIWSLIDRTSTLLHKKGDILQAQAFATGFRCAMTMLAAGLTKPGNGEAA